MSNYQETLDWFFKLAMITVHREDMLLRSLLLDRPGYKDYYAGIAAAFETGLVYTVFKDLLGSPFSITHHVDWESPVTKNTAVDLVVQRRGSGNPLIGIEVKWWETNPIGVATDLRKLRDQCAAGNIGRGAVLVIRGRATSINTPGLRALIEKHLVPGGAFVGLTENPGDARYDAIDSYWPNSVPACVEVALLDVLAP